MAHLADARHIECVVLGAGCYDEIIILEVVFGPLEHLSAAQRFRHEVDTCESRAGKGGWEGRGRTHLMTALGILIIDRASLSRRSTALTRNRDTSFLGANYVSSTYQVFQTKQALNKIHQAEGFNGDQPCSLSGHGVRH